MTGRAGVRVLITTDAVGGVWSYATTLANGLVASGCEVYLVTMGPQPQPDQIAATARPGVHVIPTDLALEWQDPAGEDFDRAAERLRKLERQLAPDLVHLNSYREAALEWTSPVLVTAHSCVNSWALACGERDFLSEPRWRRYSAAVACGLDAAQAWVGPTYAFSGVIRKLYQPAGSGTAIWNGVPAARDEIGQKEDFILAAGRMWDRAKNLAALAEAANHLDWPILVAGPTGTSGNDPTSPIELLGPLSSRALRQRMHRASVFVSPALYEPFGLSVLEAASAGCALVLSDIPTFRELWDGAAAFVDPNDSGALHRELAAICAGDLRRRQLQQAARERSRVYSVERMVAAYRRLYSDVLSEAGEPRLRAGACA
jgi:glycosyltransferase involved in cell wall biosynthesis